MNQIPSPIFVCDIANNHFGDIEHARKIIEGLSEVATQTSTKIAIKFQFRDLDSFIHPQYKNRDDLKYISRFKSTRLDFDDFAELSKIVKSNKLILMATPFDENSVDWCEELDVEIIKIASASAKDWKLLEKINRSNKPIIASTGGLRLIEIDDLYSLFGRRNLNFGLMHCVSIYPTSSSDLNLANIKLFKERYPNINIGWSTHENPADLTPVVVASNFGASIFERHVGLETNEYKLNDYSSEPNQIKKWIEAYLHCNLISGSQERVPSPVAEQNTLKELRRGYFYSKNMKKGETLGEKDTYLAFPAHGNNPISTYENLNGRVLIKDVLENNPVSVEDLQIIDEKERAHAEIIKQCKSILLSANVTFNSDAEIEISHHYGIERFREFGAMIITCYNSEYAKKIIVQLPRQKHPYHYHELKKESFQLIWGDCEIVINGKSKTMKTGELVTVERQQWHKFSTLHGAVIEEISTEAIGSDSYYDDLEIMKKERFQRKTQVKNWNRE